MSKLTGTKTLFLIFFLASSFFTIRELCIITDTCQIVLQSLGALMRKFGVAYAVPSDTILSLNSIKKRLGFFTTMMR